MWTNLWLKEAINNSIYLQNTFLMTLIWHIFVKKTWKCAILLIFWSVSC